MQDSLEKLNNFALLPVIYKRWKHKVFFVYISVYVLSAYIMVSEQFIYLLDKIYSHTSVHNEM